MFPWQQILELALMQNQPIQLSNDVVSHCDTVLNQSFQNFEQCLDL